MPGRPMNGFASGASRGGIGRGGRGGLTLAGGAWVLLGLLMLGLGVEYFVESGVFGIRRAAWGGK
jgi:hypothetical protein